MTGMQQADYLHLVRSHPHFGLADSARLMPQIRRLYVMRRPLKVFAYRRVFVVLVEPRTDGKHPPIGLDEVQDRLDLPGQVIALHRDWIKTDTALKAKAPVGEPAYQA